MEQTNLSEAAIQALAEQAQPMPLPQLDHFPAGLERLIDPMPEQRGPLPKVLTGAAGQEDLRNIGREGGEDRIPTRRAVGEPMPEDYGINSLNTIFHYTDSLVDTELMNDYPIRPTGWFQFVTASGLSARCTAQLISRSIGVTAGHCVHQGGDKPGLTRDKGWIKSATFTPAYNNGKRPYGSATVSWVNTTSGWYNAGTLDQGHDLGIFVLNKRTGTTREIGAATGYYGFCYMWCLQQYWYNTQLGYPANYYSGNLMTMGEHLETSDAYDYVYGSGMLGGSSGGGHIANLGFLSGTPGSTGQWPYRNMVFAVTSWGYTADPTLKIQGASTLSGPNNTNNFVGLYNQACTRARQLHGTGSCTLL